MGGGNGRTLREVGKINQRKLRGRTREENNGGMKEDVGAFGKITRLVK